MAEKREEIGRHAAVTGFANELIATGILMKRYGNVSQVNLPLSPYDIVAVFRGGDGKENFVRAQIRTAEKSVKFTSGSRGGVDRTYKSGEKTYRQSTMTSDVVVGISDVGSNSFDLYFVPTVLIEVLSQDSFSLSKIEDLKNNYEMFERCKDESFVLENSREFGILSK